MSQIIHLQLINTTIQMLHLVVYIDTHIKTQCITFILESLVTKDTFSRLRQVKKWGFSTSERVIEFFHIS
jgi:hypothetical protein